MEWITALATAVIAVFTGLTLKVYAQIKKVMVQGMEAEYRPLVVIKRGSVVTRTTTSNAPGDLITSFEMSNVGQGYALGVVMVRKHPSVPPHQVHDPFDLAPKDATRSSITYPELGRERVMLVITYEDLFGNFFRTTWSEEKMRFHSFGKKKPGDLLFHSSPIE